MKPLDFDGFPDESRIWIFGADRRLDEGEAALLLAAVDDFLASWKAHGVPLRAARTWRYSRFLIVCADIGIALPSGCSIDALTGVLREMEARTGVRFLGNEAVWYRDPGGRVHRSTRPEFRSLARTEEVTPASVVFDNTITSLGQLRAGSWEGAAADRWHAVFFERAPLHAGG